MQTKTTDMNLETEFGISRPHRQFTRESSAACPNRRTIHAPLPLRRRESCLTRRAMLAALREAEFYEWLASGGDYLDRTHRTLALAGEASI